MPKAKQSAILSALRQRILCGALPPGARLPTRQQIMEEFRTSRATVQGAFDRLIEDGFVRSRGSLGTFVADPLPHLSTYALVFPQARSPGRPWSRFRAALQQAATAMPHTDRRRVIIYCTEGHEHDDLRRLMKDLRARRLAGVVFANRPRGYEGTGLADLLRRQGTPTVAVMENPAGAMPAVYPDVDDFVARALDWLAGRGRRRLAAVYVDDPPPDCGAVLRAAMAARGLEVRDCWQLAFHPHLPQAARPAAELLLRTRPEDRPDGLLIGDDNLAEHVLAGLVAAGMRVGDDLDVVSHCNFPAIVPCVLPVRRIGFDARRIIEACLAVIDGLRQGRPAAEMTRIAATTEDEAEAAAPPAPQET